MGIRIFSKPLSGPGKAGASPAPVPPPTPPPPAKLVQPKRTGETAGAAKSIQEQRWDEAQVRPQWQARAEAAASKARANRDVYARVSVNTGVPWWAIAAIHLMESSQDFTTHLHNGDPLKRRTVQVPAGRPKTGNPPFTWHESAIDAVIYDGLHKVNWTDLTASLDALERFNGWGYRKHHPKVPTPYLWSGTNIYSQGKYVADGKWSSTAVSKQLGIVPFLLALREPLWITPL